MNFKHVFTSLTLAITLSFSLVFSSQAEQTITVDQLIDLNALTPDQTYRFDPNYLWIKPGETLRIVNSLGNHTVTSIKGMWPEGVEYIDIAHQAEATFKLTQEGVYGLRCKVHGRHGMYALVVVGSPAANRDKLELTNIGKRGKKVIERLIKRMDDDAKNK